MRLSISQFLQDAPSGILIDVRSPGEFAHAHIPGAFSLPLFSDEERAVVGTAYKQESREVAIKHGLRFFGPKMLGFVEQVEAWIEAAGGSTEKKIPLYLYCWRGGMRSGAMAWLLQLYGFDVKLLSGGYKSFRNWALQQFDQPYDFRVIGGFTGSGKTEMLLRLQQLGERVIDLEGIAVHCGSAFGNHKKPPQPSQEHFENILALQLKPQVQDVDEIKETIWVEDESQRIGNLNIPMSVWMRMRECPVYFFQIPFEQRLQHIFQEYGDINREKLVNAIGRISKRLGPLETKTALAFIDKDEIENAFRILLQYYDKRYLKGLHNRSSLSSLLKEIRCDEVRADNVAFLNQPA